MTRDEAFNLYFDWIAQCLEVSDKLSKWELSFIESLDEQLQRKKTLSPRQAEILEKIYADKTN